MSDLPIVEVVKKLKDPMNSLSEEEKKQIKMLTGDVDSAVKTSLIQLLMSQFNQASDYKSAIDQVMRQLLLKVPLMETDELIATLAVLSKVSAKVSKDVMDIFQKQGDNMKNLASELERLAKRGNIVDSEDLEQEEDTPTKRIINLSPEKKDKVIRLVKKISEARKLEEAEELDVAGE